MRFHGHRDGGRVHIEFDTDTDEYQWDVPVGWLYVVLVVTVLVVVLLVSWSGACEVANTPTDDQTIVVTELSYFCEDGHHVVTESDALRVCPTITDIYDDGEKERCGRALRGPFVPWKG